MFFWQIITVSSLMNDLLLVVFIDHKCFLYVFFSYFWWGKEEGARSWEQRGSREDRGLPSEPKDNFSKHSRARDDHSALFHVIWESMGRFFSSRSLTVSFPFPKRFFIVSFPFLYRFLTVSLPFPSPFLFRFHYRFFSFSFQKKKR